MKFLFGTNTYNTHAQHMALALDEAGMLHSYVTSGIDSYRTAAGRFSRRIAAAVPAVDRELSRRAPLDITPDRIRARWGWELIRVAAARGGASERLVDWIWERQEWSLDHACARLMKRGDVHGFIGVEHGALAALTAARNLGKVGLITFMSPHHAAFRRWVEPEYATFPEIDSVERRDLSQLAIARDLRRDEEAAVADWVITGSSFTSRSLVEAGLSPAKILTVPLAGPAAIDDASLPDRAPAITRVIYVGPVSVRKGAHYLLSAWKKVARKGMELHCYGKMLLPDHVWRSALNGPGGDSITFHGSIPARELSRVYLEASVLVLPTLCDGYGLVVSEAMSHGLPVITTTNAGSADAVDHTRTGFIIPPADDEALTSTLRWCADNPRALFGMRRPALEAARNRTWAEFRRTLVREVGRAIGSRDASAPPPVIKAPR